jgi:hypothetical protein
MLARPLLALAAVRSTPLVAASRDADVDVVTVAHFDRPTLFARPRLHRGVAGHDAKAAEDPCQHFPDELRLDHPTRLAHASASVNRLEK